MRLTFRADWDRVRDSLPAIAQIVAASVAAYLLAQWLLGQELPLIAAIIPISSLGFVGDARPVRVLETAIAMTLGILLAEALLLGFGQTIWTFALALAVTLLLARFVSAKAAFAISAAVQCTLVMLSPQLAEPFLRSLDALIGGVVAIAATALLPRDPWRIAIRSGRRVLATHVAILEQLALALRDANAAQSSAALATARGTTSALSNWADAVESGRAIAAVSPWLWRRRSEFARLTRMVEPIDLATRSLRVVARRADYLASLGRPEPELAGVLEQLADAVRVLSDTLADLTEVPKARHLLTERAKHLDVIEILGDDANPHEGNIVHSARPYMTDLLMATGLSLAQARAALAQLN